MREYMRRYLADPEKRAVHAARMRASSARRSAMARGGRPLRVQCAHCGGEFSPHSRAVRYCSNACRKKGYASTNAAYKRRLRTERNATVVFRKCRVCSTEFELGHGGGRRALYCSQACRTEYRLAYYRERWSRRRSGGGGGGGGTGRMRDD